MKLSNFQWTDKESVKWFIMLPSGHEGPYSLKTIKARLDGKAIGAETKIWAEGLPEAISIKQVLYQFEAALKIETTKPEVPPAIPVTKVSTFDAPHIDVEDEVPPLPPLPEEEASELPAEKKNSRRILPAVVMLSALFFLIAYFLYAQWLSGQQTFTIRRFAKMSPELHDRIHREIQFDGWDKKIFFKEYVSPDLSSIWLVNSGFQSCSVEALFTSVKGKLLSLEDGEVSFKASSSLRDHVAEFSRFEFTGGQKVIPGLYEVDIKASGCKWDGVAAKLGNKLRAPDEEYVARVRMILFPQGPTEFNSVLDRLLQKKAMAAERELKKIEVLKQDVHEKLQTLLAITMQIDQFFNELLDQDARKFEQNIKKGIDHYTRQFGHTLTNFVISNEKDFAKYSKDASLSLAEGMEYERVVRLTSKEIGLESMKIIEHLQNLKKPKRVVLNEEKKKVSKTFSQLAQKISQKLTQIESP